MKRLLLLSLAVLGACHSAALPREPRDAAPDAALDVTPDAPRDAGPPVQHADASSDTDGALATPVIVQPAPAADCKSLHLAVEGGRIFWTDEGNGLIESAALPTGAPTVIAANEVHPRALALRGSTVFWLAGALVGPAYDILSPSLRMAPASGGPATTIVTVADGIGGFTVSPDGATVYFSAGTTVRQAPAAALATAIDVSRSDIGDHARALALDGARLAYTDVLNGRIHLIDLVAGQVATCDDHDPVTNQWIGVLCERPESDNGSLLQQIVFGGGKVFWADGPSLKGYDTAVAAPLGRMLTVAQPLVLDDVTGIALAGDTLLVTTNADPASDTGTVEKVPTAADATAVLLAQGQVGPSSPAFDGDRVYWATADCRILSAPR